MEGRGGMAADHALDLFLKDAMIELAPVTHGRAYGGGTACLAALNFGDCYAYALADATGESLLFKGEDFARTDVEAA